MSKKQLLTKRFSSKLQKKLKRIPGYAGILAEKHDLSKITIYRILRGDHSPNSIDVLETANELVREYETRIISITNAIENGKQD